MILSSQRPGQRQWRGRKRRWSSALVLVSLLLSSGVVPAAFAQSQTVDDLSPRVTATLTPSQVAPGETAQLRISVLVPTFMPRPVTFPSLDQANLRVQLPERSTMPISQSIAGRTWAGVTRRYQVTPLAAGEFTLGQGPLGVTFQDPDTSETITQQLALEPQSLVVAVPDAAAGLSPYIAGTSLTLEQRVVVTRAGTAKEAPAKGVSNESDPAADGHKEDGAAGSVETLDLSRDDTVSLAIGDSLQREIVATLAGGSVLLLPRLAETASIANMEVHAASPSITETSGGGSRTEHLTYIAQHGGQAALPEIILQWYDLAQKRVVSVSIEGVDIAIEGQTLPLSGKPSQRYRDYWEWAAAVLLLGVIIGCAHRWLLPLWRQTRRKRRLRREQEGLTALAHIKKSVKARQFSDSLIAWQELLRRAPPLPVQRRQTIESCLAELGRQRYAQAAKSANSKASWRALRQALPRTDEILQESHQPLLPPLNPRAV